MQRGFHPEMTLLIPTAVKSSTAKLRTNEFWTLFFPAFMPSPCSFSYNNIRHIHAVFIEM
jgi:hypothetical protein